MKWDLDIFSTGFTIFPLKFLPSAGTESVLNVIRQVNMGFLLHWLLFPTGLLSPTWTGFFKDPCCPLSHKDKELLRENGYWRKTKRWAWRLYLEREKLVRRRTEELKRDDRKRWPSKDDKTWKNEKGQKWKWNKKEIKSEREGRGEIAYVERHHRCLFKF